MPYLSSSFTVLVRVKKRRTNCGGRSTAVPPRMKSWKAGVSTKGKVCWWLQRKVSKTGAEENWKPSPPSVAEPQRYCANFPGQSFYGEKPRCCISCCGRHQPKAILQVGQGGGSHREARKQPGNWGRGMYGGVKCHPLPFICALLKVKGGQQNQGKSPLPCAGPLQCTEASPTAGLSLCPSDSLSGPLRLPLLRPHPGEQLQKEGSHKEQGRPRPSS